MHPKLVVVLQVQPSKGRNFQMPPQNPVASPLIGIAKSHPFLPSVTETMGTHEKCDAIKR